MAGSAIVYAGLTLYGIGLMVKLARSKHGDLLELSGHIALVLFLGLALHSLENENFRKQVDTSTAILALSASLVSFIFGLTVGKSWGMALASVSFTHKQPDLMRPVKRRSDESATDTSLSQLTGHGMEFKPDRQRIFSEESVDPDAQATPSFARGDPFKRHPASAAMLLSVSSRNEIVDTFEGFRITQDFVDETVDSLTTIIGVTTKVAAYVTKKWSLMSASSNGSYLWTSVSKREGVMLKASALTHTSANAVVRWLLDRQMGTGLEGIMYRSETLLMNEKENICVQRFVCKSDRVLLSSRCFLVVTLWKRLPDNSYIIATRSLPPEIGKIGDKKSVRGHVFTSGYLIRTLSEATEGRSTEVLFGAHVSFSRAGKSNIDKAKLDEISKYVSKSLGQAVVGAADPYVESEELAETKETSNRDNLELTKEQRSDVLLVARNTLSRLETTHRSLHKNRTSGDVLVFGSLPLLHQEVNSENIGHESWNDIYDQDGIRVSERLDDTNTFGTLRASCVIDAPPSAIHNLLTKHSKVRAITSHNMEYRLHVLYMYR